MSDLMLLGVLRAPAPEPDNVLGIAQLVDRARQAADEIERLEAHCAGVEAGDKVRRERIEQLEAENKELDDLNYIQAGMIAEAGLGERDEQ